MKKFLAGMIGALALTSVAQAGELELSVSSDVHRVNRNLYVTARSTDGGEPVVGDQVEMAIAMDGNSFSKHLTKPTNSTGNGSVKLVPRTVGTINICAVSETTGATATLSVDIVE
jgi:hypothetical protein